MELMELGRLDRVERDGEALTLAERIALAFNDPKRLDRERQQFLARAGLVHPREDAMTAAARIDGRLRKELGYRH
jgi:hypothetical protein